MTVYYVNPETGDNTLNGLSWANAWKSMRGLRQNSIVPAAGDEIRFAKSAEFTPSSGVPYNVGGSQIIWKRYGAEVLNTWESDGISRYRTYAENVYGERYPFPQNTPLAGTVTPGNVAGNTSPLWANAPSGQMNATDQELFGANVSLGYWDAENRSRIMGHMRCRTAYAGAGTQDMPDGSLALVIKSYGTIVRTIPLPAIRNSATEWTPFEIDFTPLPVGELTEVWIARTSVPITRDNSPFGLEMTELSISRAEAARPLETILKFGRTSYAGGRTEEVVGSNNIRPLGEFCDPTDPNGTWVSISSDTNTRTNTTVETCLKAYKVPELPWVGTGGQSPSGSLGAFDLNGSAGGAVGNPIKLTGGWNTSTETVDGVTVFSGGVSAKYASSFALFDLGNADHVRFEDIGAAYGFKSFFTRGRSVYLKKCSLPFSVSPAFGQATQDTHVTMETMYVAPLVLQNYGIIGDLTLNDFFYVSNCLSTVDQYCEVRNLTMTNAQWGRHFMVPHNVLKKTYCRGDAVLDQCCLSYPPALVSVVFGHTLTFQNHKAYSGTGTAFLIPTSAESRWDHITYTDSTMPTYNFGSPNPTGVTCDAKVSINSQLPMFSSENANANFYPTALRGDPFSGTYVDGLAFFGRQLAPPMRGTYAVWEAMQSHLNNRTESNPAVHPTALTGQSDVAHPSWSYRVTEEDPWTLIAESDPDIAPTGRIWLARKFSNVTYRTSDTVFLCTMAGAEIAQGQQWITLKNIYVPKAGLYRAHFGFMGENLDWYNGALTIPVMEPLTLRTEYPSAADGRQIGSVAVAANGLVGLTIERPYYAATAADVVAGEGNRNLNQWRDIFIDFEVSRGCMIEMRVGSTEFGSFEMAIFDTLAVHERT